MHDETTYAAILAGKKIYGYNIKSKRMDKVLDLSLGLGRAEEDLGAAYRAYVRDAQIPIGHLLYLINDRDFRTIKERAFSTSRFLGISRTLGEKGSF
jgi:hypothetical protein